MVVLFFELFYVIIFICRGLLKEVIFKALIVISWINSLSNEIFALCRSNSAIISSLASLLVEPTRIYVPFSFPLFFR